MPWQDAGSLDQVIARIGRIPENYCREICSMVRVHTRGVCKGCIVLCWATLSFASARPRYLQRWVLCYQCRGAIDADGASFAVPLCTCCPYQVVQGLVTLKEQHDVIHRGEHCLVPHETLTST